MGHTCFKDKCCDCGKKCKGKYITQGTHLFHVDCILEEMMLNYVNGDVVYLIENNDEQ